eukprot:1233651-Ditylum_brightwellii.AAC.1
MNNLSAVPATETSKSILIIMDSLNRTRDRPNNTWTHQMFCFMFAFYLNTELKEDKTVITPDKLPMVKVHNMWEQFDGHCCGAH